jgi:hypothetical protein
VVSTAIRHRVPPPDQDKIKIPQSEFDSFMEAMSYQADMAANMDW